MWNGGFLEVAQKNWDAEGIEFNKNAINYLKKGF